MQSNFRIYLISSFIGNLVLQIFALFLPLLAYQFGANPLEVGLVGGAVYSVYSFMPFMMGRYLDRMKARKTFVVLSLSLLAATSMLYSFASTPVELIVFRILEGVGWATLWPTVDAAIGDDASREAGKSFSIYNSIWSGASSIGPLVGVALVLLLAELRYLFFVTALLLFAVTIVNLVGLAGKGSSNKEQPINLSSSADQRLATASGQTESGSSRTIHVVGFFAIVVALGQVSKGVLFTFFPPLAQSLGLSVVVIGLVGFAFGGARSITFIVTTRDGIRRNLLKRANARKNALASLAVASLSATLPIIPDKSGILNFASFILVGVSLSMITAIAQQRMIAEASSRQIGRNSGLFESSLGIGAAAGPIIAGLISGQSLLVPFLLPSFGLIGIPFLLAFFRDGTEIRLPKES